VKALGLLVFWIMKKNLKQGSDESIKKDYECRLCGEKITDKDAFNLGGMIICPKCIKRKTIPILIILLVIITFSIISIIYWIV
jgi:hypothetical protein